MKVSKKKRSKKRSTEEEMRVLIEMTVGELNGLDTEAEEWEEVEFLVGRGAGTTVIGPEDVKAVKAGEPDQNCSYKLANGSIIHNKGHNKFKVLTEDGQPRSISASATDVDKPLLSVYQVAAGGSTVVFSPNNRYIPFELPGNICARNLWVPRSQDAPFQGQACTRL